MPSLWFNYVKKKVAVKKVTATVSRQLTGSHCEMKVVYTYKYHNAQWSEKSNIAN